jgi:serum/glucocorticoid-regulated kinase 2
MKIVKNPFIVQLHYAFQTASYLYLAMDYCSKGDFSYHVVQRESLT